MANKEKAMKQEPVKWVRNNSMVVVDGRCWATTPKLRTVCVGRESDVIKEGK